MSDEIPEDIRIEAEKLAHDFRSGVLAGEYFEGAIGYAILAERERVISTLRQMVEEEAPSSPSAQALRSAVKRIASAIQDPSHV